MEENNIQTGNQLPKPENNGERQKQEKGNESLHGNMPAGKKDGENILLSILKFMSKTVWTIALVIAIIFGIVSGIMWYLNKDNDIKIETNEKIGITPTQIRSIENIGQWEFLSVSDEELIDTVRRGFFGDDELMRIYYGTLRLGVNMHDVKEGWIREEGDSIICTLPPIKLLDERFIDEANTKSFFEKGDWSNSDREDMYRRAYYKMKKRAMTKANIRTAEENALGQFRKLFVSMGLENVTVRFENRK